MKKHWKLIVIDKIHTIECIFHDSTYSILYKVERYTESKCEIYVLARLFSPINTVATMLKLHDQEVINNYSDETEQENELY